MYRKSLAIPAALAVILGGATGISHIGTSAHAKVAAESYAGTISFSDYQAPTALFGGGYGQAQVDADLASMVFDSASLIDNKGNIQPDMASNVPSSADGTLKVVGGDETLTYHVKQNLKWSDGSAITKADWIATYLINFTPDVGNIDPLQEIRTASWSGNDFVLHLKGQIGSALQQLIPSPYPVEYLQKKYGATIPASLLVSWDHDQSVDAKTGFLKDSLYTSQLKHLIVDGWNKDNYVSPSDVFSGPYKLQLWSPDQRYVLTANPYYTALPAAQGHPRPQTIQHIILSESGSTYIQDLKAGSTYNQIDLATDFDPDNITDLKQSKYQVVVQPGLSYELLDLMVGATYNGKPNPMADVRVRQALNYAINKDQYLRALYPAYDPKQLSLSSFLPASSSWSINSQLPQNAYNPVKARALLASAGYATTLGTGGNHLNLDFATTTKTSRIKGAQIFQRYFNQIGVGIKIRYLTARGTNGLFSTWKDGGVQCHHTFQISLHGYGENPDPDEASLNYVPEQTCSATNPSGPNIMNINDSHLTSLFLRGRHTVDAAQRHTIYDEIQHYFYDQAYNISLFTTPSITLVKGTVGNFKANSTQQGPLWNAYELWVDRSNSQKAQAN